MTREELQTWALPVKGLQHSLCSTCRWKHPGESTCLAFGGGAPPLFSEVEPEPPLILSVTDPALYAEYCGLMGLDPETPPSHLPLELQTAVIASGTLERRGLTLTHSQVPVSA